MKEHDKPAQIVRELKVGMLAAHNIGNIYGIKAARNCLDYLAHAEKHGLYKDGILLDFYDKKSIATDIDHVKTKGKGGNFTKYNAIPVKRSNNPTAGFTNPPIERTRRIAKEKANVCEDDAERRIIEWIEDESNLINPNYEQALPKIQKYQDRLAELVDIVMDEFSQEMGMGNPVPKVSRNGNAKKPRNRKIK